MTGIQRYIAAFTLAISFVAMTPAVSQAMGKKKSEIPDAPPPFTDPLQWFDSQSIAGNRLEMYSNGIDTKAARVALIQGARQTLWLSAYAFGGDDFAEFYAAQICQKARQGVDVRLLLDNHGSSGSKRFKNGLENCGARIIYYNPPNWGLDQIPFVIHEKLMIADGRRMITGGSGFENIYKSYGRLDDTWYDMDFGIEGPTACWFHQHFARFWAEAASRDDWDDGLMGDTPKSPQWLEYRYGLRSLRSDCDASPVPGAQTRLFPVYTNPMTVPKKVRPLFRAYQEAMNATPNDGTIRLYAPYFVPTDDFVNALLAAHRRGVKVQILTNSPESIDPEGRPVVLATFMTVRNLIQQGVEVYLWPRKNTMHRKGGLYAGKWAYFGTDNLDRRGANYESENIVFTDDPVIVQKLAGEMEGDFRLGERLTVDLIDKLTSESKGWQKAVTPVLLNYL